MSRWKQISSSIAWVSVLKTGWMPRSMSLALSSSVFVMLKLPTTIRLRAGQVLLRQKGWQVFLLYEPLVP